MTTIPKKKKRPKKPCGGLREEEGFNYLIKSLEMPLSAKESWACCMWLLRNFMHSNSESQEERFVLCRTLDGGDLENTFYQNRFVGHI